MSMNEWLAIGLLIGFFLMQSLWVEKSTTVFLLCVLQVLW